MVETSGYHLARLASQTKSGYVEIVTIEAIKTAIQELTDSERSQVVSWLETFREQEWDREIERDFAPGGRGEWLLDELNREIDEGLTLPIEEACRENRRRH